MERWGVMSDAFNWLVFSVAVLVLLVSGWEWLREDDPRGWL